MFKSTHSLASHLVGPSGEFCEQMRVLGVRQVISTTSRRGSFNGEPYTLLLLGSAHGTINGLLWHTRFGDRPTHFGVGDIVEFEGRIAYDSPTPYLNISEFEWIDPANMTFAALFPLDWTPLDQKNWLKNLEVGWSALTDDDIRCFLAETFLPTQVAQGLLNSPASVKHHHKERGGLLWHVSEMVSEYIPQQTLSNIDSDVAFALKLTHDLGKIVTIRGNSISPRGRFQPHEIAALELISDPLKSLAARNPEAANLIRGSFAPRSWFPHQNSEIYRLVAKHDRASAGMGGGRG